MGALGWIEIVCLFVFASLVFGSHFVLQRTFPNWGREQKGNEEKAVLISLFKRLGKLHTYLLRTVAGLAAAFILCFIFNKDLYKIASNPLVALLPLGTKLVFTNPADPFKIYLEVALPFAVFLASPWIFYQVWAFIAPALHAPECRWANRFVIGSAAMFILGGLVGYFVALPRAGAFLLGITRDAGIQLPFFRVTDIFELFARIVFGIGLLFELSVVVFFLAALRIVPAGLLLKGRWFTMPIFMFVAAIVTPTRDAFNLMLIFMPMCLFFYIGAFAGNATVLKSEGHKFQWRKLIPTFSLLFLDIFLAVFSCLLVDYVLIWRLHLEP